MKEVALVTGATSGIGWAISLKLAQRGAIVGLMGRSQDRAAELAREIEAIGGESVVLIGDVSCFQEVQRLTEELVRLTGQLNTTVANAGIVARGTTVVDMPLDEWEQLIATNISGVFFTAKAVMPHLIRSKGTFTAISSDAGVKGGAGYAAYTATKHAVNGLVKSMALDHGHHGVRCNVVAPGATETPMLKGRWDTFGTQDREKVLGTIALGRLAHASEVAAAVAHISSDAASYVTGAVYAVDGGTTN